jgi:hypothetical protein
MTRSAELGLAFRQQGGLAQRMVRGDSATTEIRRGGLGFVGLHSFVNF